MNWWNDDPDESDERYDESSVRIRPNRRGTRPRTKIRPAHSNAVSGFVVSVDRGRYDVMVEENTPNERIVRATTARELPRKSVVTGDRVELVGDVSGEEGGLARIVRVNERSSVLRRSADDTDEVERIIVANADQLMIVCASTNPEPRVRLVDRYLVAAYDAGIAPLLCMTKTDLADPSEFLAYFDGLDIPVFLSRSDDPPLESITDALIGHRTVFVGHSGVGKSTLVNALVPSANRATGVVNEVTGRGRHTSSSSLTLRVQRGKETGWVIDTPGIRSFGLGHVNADNILDAFPDLAAFAVECPRGCDHAQNALECAVAEGALAAEGSDGVRLRARLDSLHRLISSLHST